MGQILENARLRSWNLTQWAPGEPFKKMVLDLMGIRIFSGTFSQHLLLGPAAHFLARLFTAEPKYPFSLGEKKPEVLVHNCTEESSHERL